MPLPNVNHWLAPKGTTIENVNRVKEMDKVQVKQVLDDLDRFLSHFRPKHRAGGRD
jgi:hypothetical protein